MENVKEAKSGTKVNRHVVGEQCDKNEDKNCTYKHFRACLFKMFLTFRFCLFKFELLLSF